MLVAASILSKDASEVSLSWLVRREELRNRLKEDGLRVYFQNATAHLNFSPKEDEDLASFFTKELQVLRRLDQEFQKHPSINISLKDSLLAQDLSELRAEEPEVILCCVKAYDLLALRAALRDLPAIKIFVCNGFWLNPGLDLGVLYGGGFSRENLLCAVKGGKLVIGRVKSPYTDFLISFTEENQGGALVYSLEELEILETLSRNVNEELLTVEIEIDIYSKMLKKAIVNCVVNALSAICLSQNGFLLEKWARNVWASVLFEIHSALRAAHFLPPNSEEFTLNALSQEVEDVCKLTGGNLSSMLIDVLRGRRTEIRQLNQVIASLGARYGVPTPMNNLLVELIEKCSSPASG